MLKHDIETKPEKALIFAEIEKKYDLEATFYVQSYLLNDKNNSIFQRIKKLGHEVTYHYDVLDASGGDWKKAEEKFDNMIKKFNKFGFEVETVCPHGNPIIIREGWLSNKDFFRNPDICKKYKYITDIIVNFPKSIYSNYLYISDSGYALKIIGDIANNDKEEVKTPDKKIYSFREIIKMIDEGNSFIISIHPHRWHSNSIAVLSYRARFIIMKWIANFFQKNSFLKKIITKFYYLAKKI
jgi:hypothetical protein